MSGRKIHQIGIYASGLMRSILILSYPINGLGKMSILEERGDAQRIVLPGVEQICKSLMKCLSASIINISIIMMSCTINLKKKLKTTMHYVKKTSKALNNQPIP